MIINLRAWYKGKMYQVARLDMWGDPDQATCDLASLDFSEEELFGVYLHEVILMQFTGLKDKNGKEIYEGDILQVETGWYKSKKDNLNDRFDNGVKGITYWTVEHKIHSCKVGYMAYGIDRRFNRVLTPSMIFNNKAEIIGNIHDNPKILKED